MTARFYLQLDGPEAVLDGMDSLKQKLIHARKLLKELHSVRTQENHALAQIEESAEEMQGRLKSIHEELR